MMNKTENHTGEKMLETVTAINNLPLTRYMHVYRVIQGQGHEHIILAV